MTPFCHPFLPRMTPFCCRFCNKSVTLTPFLISRHSRRGRKGVTLTSFFVRDLRDYRWPWYLSGGDIRSKRRRPFSSRHPPEDGTQPLVVQPMQVRREGAGQLSALVLGLAEPHQGLPARFL